MSNSGTLARVATFVVVDVLCEMNLELCNRHTLSASFDKFVPRLGCPRLRQTVGAHRGVGDRGTGSE